MSKSAVALLLVLLATASFAGPKRGRPPKRARHDAAGVVVLDGVRTAVKWTDGDSFKVNEGPYRGRGTRLVGYNTLEAYGPVHSWGGWTPDELFELAAAASGVAAAGEWSCTTRGKEDGYHRLLVDCPELAVEMARTGTGLAYAVDGERPAPRVLEAQREAQAAGAGMWRRGVVKGVLTSVHSLGEDGEVEADATVYNRVVDTRTGQALKRVHAQRYGTCETVCEETEGDRSCMVYVPFKRRYGNRPACLAR
jgi:endonuclease YncB( thermonuclease family)